MQEKASDTKQGHEPGTKIIEEEYRRLDETWLSMQGQALFWLVILSFVLEIVMFFVLRAVDILTISTGRYVVKYVVAPAGVNFLLLFCAYHVRRNTHCSSKTKIYTVSLVMALCCFVIYTVHSVFSALYLIFTLPMLLTVVYADRLLTLLVSVVSIAWKLVSDLWIYWDVDRGSVFDTQITTANFWLSIIILMTFSVICQYLIRIEKEKNDVSLKLERERRRMQTEAMTDSLTTVGNRQALREAFYRMENSAKNVHILAMMDVDQFKNLNDKYGHSCGDACLTALGRILLEECGDSVQAFRFGGDEFCVLFEGITLHQSGQICRRIQERFRQVQSEVQGPEELTLSIGVAAFRVGEQPFELLQRADKALYRAKQSRGSMIFADSE